MDMELLKLYIKQVLQENGNLLGEPDTTTEKHRDEPQPQYEEEEDLDADEHSAVAGIAGHVAPAKNNEEGSDDKK